MFQAENDEAKSSRAHVKKLQKFNFPSNHSGYYMKRYLQAQAVDSVRQSILRGECQPLCSGTEAARITTSHLVSSCGRRRSLRSCGSRLRGSFSKMTLSRVPDQN